MSATSSRAKEVARLFGIDSQIKAHGSLSAGFKGNKLDSIKDSIAPGKIILITGASGAGKSSLLRAIRKRSWIDLDRIELQNRCVIDLLEDLPVMVALRELGAVGLGEAWTYLKKPNRLSEGQRWRLKLAIALQETNNAQPARNACAGPKHTRCPRPARSLTAGYRVLVADEFCALLDRITAKVVSRTLRRAVDSRKNICAILATSHDDLVEALQPDVIVRCDFGKVEIGNRDVTRASRP